MAKKKNPWDAFWKDTGKKANKFGTDLLKNGAKVAGGVAGAVVGSILGGPVGGLAGIASGVEWGKDAYEKGIVNATNDLFKAPIKTFTDGVTTIVNETTSAAEKIPGIGPAITETKEETEKFLGAQTDGQIAALESQKAANEEKRLADEAHAKELLGIAIGQKDLQFAEDEKAAGKIAAEYDAKALETQRVTDQERITGTFSIASALGKAAGQSIQDNRQASLQANQLSRDLSTTQARSGMSGVKQSGSSAVYISQAQMAADEEKQNNINSIKSGLDSTISGVASAKQQMETSYQSAMFDKNAMIQKAGEIRDSYKAGGQAYNLYQGTVGAMRANCSLI